MRFRKLTTEELISLEKEFISFLAVCGIEAKDWELMKVNDREGVNLKIEEFSDTVIGSILAKAKYLEHKTPTDLKVFKCSESQMELLALHSKTIDLSQTIEIESLQDSDVEVFKASKGYSSNREDELYQMMKQGCVITDHLMFDLIGSIVK